MGLPQIMIKFKTAGGTAIRRSARGQVVLLLPGEGGTVSFSRLEQADRGQLGEEAWLLLQLCFLGNPAKVHLVYYAAGEESAALAGCSKLAEGGWLCAPAMEAQQVTGFIRTCRSQGKPLRAVVSTDGSPNCEGIVNFTTQGITLRLEEEPVTVTAARYCARIAGILAGISSGAALHAAQRDVVIFLEIVTLNDVLIVVSLIVTVSQCPLIQSAVIGHQHAHFARRKDLPAHHRHGGNMPEGADLSTLVHRSVGMGNVLDDIELVTVGDLHDGIHVARIAEIVNNHDRLGLGRDAPLQILRIKAQLVVDITENGRSTEIHSLGNASPIGLGGADDLISKPQADGKHRRCQRHGAVGKGESVFSALPRGKFILELDGNIGS